MDTAALLLSVSQESWQRDQDPCLILNRSRAWPVLAAIANLRKQEVEKLRSCLDGISSSALGSLSSYNNRKGQAKGFLGLKDRETQARGKKNL